MVERGHFQVLCISDHTAATIGPTADVAAVSKSVAVFSSASDKVTDTAHLSPLQLADVRDLPRAGNLGPDRPSR